MTTKTTRRAKPKADHPYFFVSYSMREPNSNLFLMLLWTTFRNSYEMKVTPSALSSGSSQLQQITKLIADSQFGVVLLDGLRPNVVFEFGMLKSLKKPLLIFKEKQAQIDVRGFLNDPAQTPVANVTLDVNLHFSNVKDINYALWDAADVLGSARAIRDEYEKKRKEITGSAEVEPPRLWS